MTDAETLDGGHPAFKASRGEAIVGPLAVPSRPEDAQILDLALDELEDSPFQVKQYDDSRVKDLAETLRRQGLLQPATVRRINGRYQLISGHARRAALRLLRDKVATSEAERTSYSTIRCLLLLGVDDARAAALTAIENLQRDDGTPLEQALMVARARSAANYRSVAETADALGLPRTRVRQYLELAEAPSVLQRAVAPGVLVGAEDGKSRKRVALPITNVLGARAYYDFFFANRLAELKAEAAVQQKRDERRGRLDDSAEAKKREETRALEANEFATEMTERLLLRAIRQAWTAAQLKSHVRVATKPGSSQVNCSSDGGSGAPAPRSPRLYDDKGGRLTIWPHALASAGVTERVALANKLRAFLEQLGT